MTTHLSLREKGQIGTLIAFFVAGYPDLATCERLISTAINCGVRTIEIGVPFSDPIADGPTIQRASAQALKNDIQLASCLGLIDRLKSKSPETTFILFTYLNPILQFQTEKYVKRALASGVSATLTVDLPFEESFEHRQIHHAHGLGTTFLISPTTGEERARQISASSEPFVYYVSRLGVTGAQSGLSRALNQEVSALRRLTAQPIAVGFGLSSPEQVQHILEFADSAIVGSHFINLIETSTSVEGAEQEISQFIQNCLSFGRTSFNAVVV